MYLAWAAWRPRILALGSAIVSAMSSTLKTKAAVAAPTRALVVNGAAIGSTAATLAELIADLGYGDGRVATARNGEFVAVRLRAETVLAEGDRIEIVAPRQGG
jgi:sulfur carrier protein